MCLSIPKRVVEWEGEGEFAGDFAWVERDGQRERVNMMLIGPQPVGTWVVNFLGSARDVVTAEEASLINSALDGLSAAMRGETDLEQYFPAIPAASSSGKPV